MDLVPDSIIKLQCDVIDTCFAHGDTPRAFAIIKKMQGVNKSKKSRGLIALRASTGYLYENKYAESIGEAYSALHCMQEVKNRQGIADSFNALYFVWHTIKDYDQAIRCLDSIIEYEKEDPVKCLVEYAHMGDVLMAKKDYKKSNTYFFKTLKITDSLALQNNLGTLEKKWKIIALSCVSYNYLKLKTNKLSSIYLNKSLDYYPTRDASIDDMIDTQRAEYLMSLKKYSEAIFYLKTIIYRNKAHDPGFTTDAYYFLSKCYAAVGDYKKAYVMQDVYTAYRDSMLTENDITEVSRKEVAMYLKEKDNVIKANKAELLGQQKLISRRNWTAIALATLTVMVLLLFYFVNKNYKVKKKLLNEKLENERKDKKLQLIEAGIEAEEKERDRIGRELHDAVVSELMVIRINIESLEKVFTDSGYEDQYRNILHQSGTITEKLRRTAHNLIPQYINDKGLFDAVKDFVDAVKSSEITIRYQFYGVVPPIRKLVEKVIFFMVLELLQNIIKHSHASEATIQISCLEDVITITAEDNGVGFEWKDEVFEGLGLDNIKKQVSLLNGTIEIQSNPDIGSTVYIELPLEQSMLL